jgi:HSP20 family molecular chaperone IbpA
MWTGFKAIVVALSFPDGSPEGIQISITGTCLQIRGAAQSDFVSQEINLPCPVQTRAIRIEDGRGTIYILLQKN